MSGVKGRSGPKKKPSTLVNEALDAIRQDLPELFKSLRDMAVKEPHDREAAIYLIDRILGKPKQQTDIDLSGGQELGAGLMVQLFKILTERQKELESREVKVLEAGDNGDKEATGKAEKVTVRAST